TSIRQTATPAAMAGPITESPSTSARWLADKDSSTWRLPGRRAGAPGLDAFSPPQAMSVARAAVPAQSRFQRIQRTSRGCRTMSAALQWNVEIRPLSPILAAEVLGLDLRRPLDAQTRDAVHEAFIRYHVLCFRDQHLSPEEQIAFTEQFVTLERHMARNKGKMNPLVHIVSNLDADGK